MRDFLKSFLIIISLSLTGSSLSLAFSKKQSNRHEGVLKVKYSSDGKKYKACCQGFGGIGPCSEQGSLYTITYDIFHSEPGDPCSYTDLYAGPTPTPTPANQKRFDSTIE
jgi:hypothetical protein